MKSKNKNLAMLEEVARALKSLNRDVVYVGGAVASLYFDDLSSPLIRPTDDVDCVVEILTRSEFSKLEDELRKLKFVNDMTPGAPTCRWKYLGITVDIMPSDGKILGFSNRWYPIGIKQKELFHLSKNLDIHIFPMPIFLASKFEAYHERGGDDPRLSSDMEDIVLVLDGSLNSVDRVVKADKKVREYLRKEFGYFLTDSTYREAVDVFLRHEGKDRIKRWFLNIEKMLKNK